jgi:uncharacterized protein (TIGR03437 family)
LLRPANPVTDAASFRPDTSFGVAPGSYISIFGTALADATQVEPTASLPYALSTVSVSFDAGNGDGTYLSVPGRIHFVTPGQVNVQVPWEFQGRPSVQVKVSVGVIPTSVYTLKLANYSPGVVEYSDGGTRIAATIDVDPAAPSAAYIVSQRTPARRGHALELFLNGLGPVSNRPASGEPSPSSPIAQTNETPRVTIGGVPAPVSFAGLAPGIVGLYQVNVTVPENVSPGLVPVVISIGSVDSAPSSLPVQ